ncbi:hypothetical protein BDR22DRAFT_964154 [Usnea florida]
MQKWHIHAAIGRGRPIIHQRRSTFVSRSRLHTTPIGAQEDSKEKFSKEPSSPQSNRSKRLQEAAASIENLYLGSTAHESARPSHSKPNARPPSRVSTHDDAANSASSRFGGVRLSKDVIEGTLRAGPSDGGKSTTGVVRRQPIPRAEVPTGREENQSALDARRFGARPEGAQGPLLIRRLQRGGPPSDTRGPSERSIFQSRDPQGKHDVQSGPRGQLNRFQQRAPRGETGFQQRPIQARGPTGNNGAGRSRASRNSDASESRRRQRGAQSGSGKARRGNREEEPLTNEEKQYLQDKELESQKSLEYTPMEFGREMLTETWPATASDDLGASEMLRERLLLARRYLDRDFISWGSRDQKADVMALAEKLKAVRKATPTDGGDKTSREATPVSGNGDQQVQALMEKLFRGAYGKIKPGRCEILTHVERHALRNDSYHPPDEEVLLETVKKLLPNRKLGKGGGKNKVEA